MPLIFAEKNEKLRQKFEKAVPHIPTTDDAFSLPEPKVILSCSNPWFTFGGGFDAILRQHYPEECSWMEEGVKQTGSFPVGYMQRRGGVVFTVTVDENLKAHEKEIRSLLHALKNASKTSEETFVFTGMGCGIGGMDEDKFIEMCGEVFGRD